MTPMIKLIMPTDGGWEKRERGLCSSCSLNLIPRRLRISGAIWQACTMSVYCKTATWLCVLHFKCKLNNKSAATTSQNHTQGWYSSSLGVYVRSDIAYKGAPCSQHGTSTCGHVYIPAHPHPWLYIWRGKAEKERIRSSFQPHQEPSPAHNSANKLQRELSHPFTKCGFFTTCFYFLSLQKHAASSPGTVIDTCMEALGTGSKHDWLSWGGGGRLSILDIFFINRFSSDVFCRKAVLHRHSNSSH